MRQSDQAWPSGVPAAGLLAVVCLCLGGFVAFAAQAETCADYVAGEKQIFWGDLHVHSGYSLDAWGYGTSATPAEAYGFAKGAPLRLVDGSEVSLPRPLDFMAVTDHAEWLDLMYICTDPLASDHAYCDILTERNTPATGSEVFAGYVLPTITKAQPQATPLCQELPELCASAQLSQWQRIQQQANEAYEPCAFTSFIAFEWSATPDYSHNHRNIIFANDKVTPQAIDYLRFPTPQRLWQELNRQCQAEDGCEAIAIPHNTNMGDGKSFDVERESSETLALRARYERLVEIHQEKGNSECLAAFGSIDEDCGFELYLTKNSRPMNADGYTQQEWEQTRRSYVRQLLLRGLYGYEQSGRRLNPLRLGIIGSTDNHAGTGGFVDEDTWPGTVFGMGDFERAMTRVSWNPGGLVAVWAEQNTRASIFAALQRREVYATSGPRVRVRLTAADTPLSCDGATPENTVAMGGTLGRAAGAFFMVQAQADRVPLERVEVIRGYLRDGELREQVAVVWSNDGLKGGAADVCTTWQDREFEPDGAAFWYARIIETPTPRWSAYLCQREGRCDEYPQADQWVQERAWTSPVWYLPDQL